MTQSLGKHLVTNKTTKTQLLYLVLFGISQRLLSFFSEVIPDLVRFRSLNEIRGFGQGFRA